MRDNGVVRNRAVYVVIGVNLEGIKEVLGIWIGESESSKFWLSVLSEIKSRGTQDLLICSVDFQIAQRSLQLRVCSSSLIKMTIRVSG